MKQSTICSNIFKSALVAIAFSLVGCAGVQRPDAMVCGINAKAMKLRCYNIKDDFTEEGVLKDGAVAKEPIFSSIQDLNGGIYFSPKDFEKIKVWLSDMRDWSKDHCR